MRRVALIIFACALFCLAGCEHWSDIPKGYTDKEEHFDQNGFQDYTDYCKYFYDSNPVLSDSRYHAVSDSNIAAIKGYFVDFRSWMEAGDRLEEYDFEDECIGEGDYVRIVTKYRGEQKRYADYDVYFYDTEAGVLYYIHQNV